MQNVGLSGEGVAESEARLAMNIVYHRVVYLLGY